MRKKMFKHKANVVQLLTPMRFCSDGIGLSNSNHVKSVASYVDSFVKIRQTKCVGIALNGSFMVDFKNVLIYRWIGYTNAA